MDTVAKNCQGITPEYLVPARCPDGTAVVCSRDEGSRLGEVVVDGIVVASRAVVAFQYLVRTEDGSYSWLAYEEFERVDG